MVFSLSYFTDKSDERGMIAILSVSEYKVSEWDYDLQPPEDGEFVEGDQYQRIKNLLHERGALNSFEGSFRYKDDFIMYLTLLPSLKKCSDEFQSFDCSRIMSALKSDR